MPDTAAPRTLPPAPAACLPPIWAQTASGRAVPLLLPKPEHIDVRDVAVGLARTARFNGHSTAFYSVAQHSVVVHDLAPTALRPYALLHDAHEAYIGDITSPVAAALAHLAGHDFVEELKQRFDAAIFAAFGLPWPLEPARAEMLRQLDRQALACERRDLLGPCECDWALALPLATGRPIQPLPWDRAETLFLDRCERLGLRPAPRREPQP